jgi:hypothetical protein
MKKIFLGFVINILPFIILPFITLPSFCLAQEEGNFNLSLIGDYTQFQDRGIQSYGLYAEYYLNESVSLGYHFSMGANSYRQFSSHISMGSWLAAYPFSIFINTADEFYLYLAVLAIVIPESINFHIRPSDNFLISPYIAPLGMYYEAKDDFDINNRFQAGYSAGIRLNIFGGNVSLAPYGGIRSLYRRNAEFGFVGGASLGVVF